MHTARSSSCWGVLHQAAPLWSRYPLDQAPPWEQTPSYPWDQAPSWEQTPGPEMPRAYPPCEQNYWHTLVKILPCPKLCLWVVINWISCSGSYLCRLNYYLHRLRGCFTSNCYTINILYWSGLKIEQWKWDRRMNTIVSRSGSVESTSLLRNQSSFSQFVQSCQK